MIPHGDLNWEFASEQVEVLMTKDHCNFTQAKKQKALVHTWLAWQKEPGKPFGAAVQAGYFNINAPSVEPFLNWFSKTFTLEEKTV